MAIDQSKYQEAIRKEKWSFLYKSIDKKPLDLKYVKENCVPFGPKSNLISHRRMEYSALVQKVYPQIINEVSKRGFDLPKGKLNLDVLLYSQLYGVPDEEQYTVPYLEYCKQAIAFLYDRLQGLDKHIIDWTIINKGDNYSEDFNQRCFIGHSYFDVAGVEVTNGANPKQKFDLPVAIKYHQGSRGVASFDRLAQHIPKLEWFYLFIAPSKHALSAPFAEVIPITTIKRKDAYSQEAGYDAATQADEALAEAISHYLSLGIAKELNIPDSIKHIQESSKGLIHKVYEYVPHAMRWVQKQGMQNGIQDAIQRAFDLYMESPKKFMDEITKHSP